MYTKVKNPICSFCWLHKLFALSSERNTKDAFVCTVGDLCGIRSIERLI